MNNKQRQLFFSVILLWSLSVKPIYSYSSEIFSSKDSRQTHLYFNKDLKNLTIAVKPRFIELIDTQNYKQSNKILTSGILFTIKNYNATSVNFVSDFDNYVMHPMTKNDKGVWYYIFELRTYKENIKTNMLKYKFVVDGLFVNDSTHINYTEDNAGGLLSIFYFTSEQFKPEEGVIVLQADTLDNKKVLFRIYRPDAKSISLMSSFNNWDSNIDKMKRTDDGYFEISKSLPYGEYVYLYKIDQSVSVDQKSPELKYNHVFGKVGYFKLIRDK